MRALFALVLLALVCSATALEPHNRHDETPSGDVLPSKEGHHGKKHDFDKMVHAHGMIEVVERHLRIVMISVHDNIVVPQPEHGCRRCICGAAGWIMKHVAEGIEERCRHSE